MPIYYAYSPTVLSPPVDWPDRMQVTGYWFLDPPPGWQPPADLLHFLQTGPAPVTIGFGSMASRDAEPYGTKRPPHNILYAVGKSNLANPLAILAAIAYTHS